MPSVNVTLEKGNGAGLLVDLMGELGSPMCVYLREMDPTAFDADGIQASSHTKAIPSITSLPC